MLCESCEYCEEVAEHNAYNGVVTMETYLKTALKPFPLS